MNGPWEDYKPTAKPKKSVEIESGPWTEYGTTEEVDPYAGLKKSATEALPAIGEAIGSIATKPTFLPSVVGAAAGRGLGTLAQKGIEQFTEEKPQEPLEAAKEVGLQTARGAGEGLLGYGAAKAVGLLGKGIGTGYKKMASAATKLPEETLEYYAKNSAKIADVAEQIGKDPEQYADVMRSGFDKKISSFMNDQNKVISSKLETAPSVKTSPIIDSLEKSKSKITRVFPEAKQVIDNEIKFVKSLGDEISASEMHDIKQRFQDLVNYTPTETFRAAQPQINNAFRQAAREARKSVNIASPEVAQANNNLYRLWDVKDTLNKNLIQEGKPSGALVQAGIGRNPRAMKNLERLSEITGHDFVTPTKEFGIGAQMSRAGLLGDIPTGYGLAPLAMGALTGGGVGGVEGLLIGAGTAAATSPLGVKHILPTAYKYGPGLLKAAQRGTKGLIPAASYLLENE